MKPPVKTQPGEQQRLPEPRRFVLEEPALSEPLLRMILTHLKPSGGEQCVEFACIKIEDFCAAKITIRALTGWITRKSYYEMNTELVAGVYKEHLQTKERKAGNQKEGTGDA